jgi:hypothetical protein
MTTGDIALLHEVVSAAVIFGGMQEMYGAMNPETRRDEIALQREHLYIAIHNFGLANPPLKSNNIKVIIESVTQDHINEILKPQ